MVFSILKMSVLLLSILGVSSGLQHCQMSKEIKPCTCNYRLDAAKVMMVHCEKMNSYEQIVDTFRGHFNPSDRVALSLKNSNLADMQNRSLSELNMTLEDLRLNNDFLGNINYDSFDGLDKVHYFSLADNNLEVVPKHLWKAIPHVKTLDMGRSKIRELTEGDFNDLRVLECLVLPGNQISRMDPNVIPTGLIRLHLGRNYIKDLNNTLRNLSNLVWLFLNSNELYDLEGQLPTDAPKLKLIHASHNKIEKLPQQLKTFPFLDSLFMENNKLKSLDGALSKSKNLIRVVLDHNQIDTITEDDFTETVMLESLLLGHNQISSLNNSLSNLKNLHFLNMTFNLLTEFSFQEIVELQQLMSMDLSHNRIATLIGPIANMLDWNFKLTDLKLDNNEIKTLAGALSGLVHLTTLNLSFNKLKKISPDDFIGLDQLQYLDVSHNLLTTLEETSKTYLPKLSVLKASHNYLTILERDFHGLPVLCSADLSNNQIVALGRELVSRTRCKIENGLHEGAWDTLKIYLQDNPILCDAALPDIVSLMEINHTKIIGVSYCPPLSEQPTTSKPNGFLGYIPEKLVTPSVITVSENQQEDHSEPNGIHKPVVEVQYQVEDEQNRTPTVLLEQPIAFSLQKHDNISSKNDNDDQNKSVAATQTSVATQTTENAPVPDTNTKIFVEQGQRINELASEIEELRTRLDQLSSQNELLLQQQFSKNITEHGKP